MLQLRFDEGRDAPPHPLAMLSRLARGPRLMDEEPMRALVFKELWRVGAAANIPEADVSGRDSYGQQCVEHLGEMIADDPHSEIRDWNARRGRHRWVPFLLRTWPQ